MMRLAEVPLTSPLPDILAAPPGDAVRLYWLGQAGFVIEGGRRRVVIDPYLSDSLAEKYRGTPFPHTRLMPPPVAPDQIRHADLVLATHAHTDHLDPGTLPALMSANPQAVLIAPASARELAMSRAGIGSNRVAVIDAGETIHPRGGIQITATRASHESIDRDAAGHHLYLGYGIEMGELKVFHSGDTIPYDGQTAEVRALRADLALLPVNGRDATRAARGVPGNFYLHEAADLAAEAGIRSAILHHFDLFAFNTVPRTYIEALAAGEQRIHLRAARTGVVYVLDRPEHEKG